jgi:ribosome-associated translation inhibitor RaiA
LQQLVFLFLGKQIVCADREKEGMMRGMRDEVRTQNTELTKVVQDWKKITTKMTAQQHKRAHFSLPNAFKNITLHLNKKNIQTKSCSTDFFKTICNVRKRLTAATSLLTVWENHK